MLRAPTVFCKLKKGALDEDKVLATEELIPCHNLKIVSKIEIELGHKAIQKYMPFDIIAILKN